MAEAARARGLDAAVDAFLAHAAVERGLAPKSIEAYGRDLARAVAWLEGEGVKSVAALRREHVVGFARALERDGLSARSRARALVAAARTRCSACRIRSSSAGCRACCAPTRPLR